MPTLTINEAWNKGMLAKTSKLILPVQKRTLTLSKEDTGLPKEQELYTNEISECHCISTGKVENGMLDYIGEAMPIYITFEGEIGARRGPTTLHYTCARLFDLPQGISARHITLGHWKKYKKRLRLSTMQPHWLATNECQDYNPHTYLGMLFMRNGYVKVECLYWLDGEANSANIAVRPVYHLPIHNPNIRIEVPEEGEELRLILP